MNKQDIISHLRDCGRLLEQLADHLEELDCDFLQGKNEITQRSESERVLSENTDENADENTVEEVIADVISEDVIEETVEETVEETAADTNTVEAAAPKPTSAAPRADASNPFARLFAGLNLGGIPNGANPFNLMNMLTGGLGGLGGNLGNMNLPKTLAELHDNPQVMNIINQVAANPQSLNMLAQLSGQNPETLQAALSALQSTGTPPISAATPITAPVAAPVAPPVQAPLMQAQAIAPNIVQATPATAHLDSLLAEWHWGPYARVWSR